MRCNSVFLHKLAMAALLLCASRTVAQPKLEEMANDPPRFLESARKQLKWDEPAEPTRIVGPVYFVGTKGLSVFLITTSDGHIVLNTGMPGSGPMIEKSIRKLGFKPEDVKILLTGHAHVDHVGGHAYLKKVSGGKIAMIREEKMLFESGGKLDFQYAAYKEFGFEPSKVDTVFDDGDEIKLGDVTLKALLTSGHTRGSTTFVMQVLIDGQVRTVVFPNGTSVNPGYRLIKNLAYPEIADDFRRTLRVLESLKPDVWLMAHNEAYAFDAKAARAIKDGPQAWMDPEGYRKWVAVQREKFDAALSKELGEKPEPTAANVHYGEHERQVLDFYQAKSDRPAPVLFFIHGGGWVAGDKSGVNPQPYLDAGISVVSINYRYSWQAQLAGIKPPVKSPLEDAARALQFVRSKAAEWKLDKERIGASGTSAGACSSLWLLFHKEMADPRSEDPIARESTRLWTAAVNGAQTSLDPKELKEWTPNSRYGGHAFGFMDPNDIKTRDTRFAEFLEHREEVLPWIREYSPIEHVSADDPPVYLYYSSSPALGQEQKDPTHTANYGVKLQERCQGVAVDCELVYPDAPHVKHKSIDDFLIEKLKAPAAK